MGMILQRIVGNGIESMYVSKVNDYKEYEQKCQLIEERCLSDEKPCHKKTHECFDITGKMPERKKCKNIGYCIGNNCENYK